MYVSPLFVVAPLFTQQVIEVFGLVRLRYGAPDIFVTVTVDGEKRWKSNVVSMNVDPKWIMKDPIKL
jgi:hypothetical protein